MTTVLVIRGGDVDDAGCSWAVCRSRGPTTSASRAGSVQDDDEGLRPGRSDPLSGVPDGVYHLDHDRVLTYVNAAGEAMLGCAADQMLGRPFFGTFPGLRGTVVE